jgi:hypothetical protein
MRTSRFWKALDEFAGAAPQIEWVRHLGDQWVPGAALLRPSGRLAEELACRKASEAGCTRRIVTLTDGRRRAECGDVPRRCDSHPVTKDEIAVLEVDVQKLAKALVGAFDLQDAPDISPRTPVVGLGRFEISAGHGFLVFLGLPRRHAPDPLSSFAIATSPPGPKVLLVPVRDAIDPGVWSFLTTKGVVGLALDDVVVWDAKRTLAPRLPASDLFREAIDLLHGARDGAKPAPSLKLAVGARWRDVAVEFENAELIRITAPGLAMAASPSDLGMADRRSGNANAQWTWFRLLAQHGGRMPTGSPSAQKQKQIVCGKLSMFFGLADAPIEDDDGHYVARFRITGDSLSQGRPARA